MAENAALGYVERPAFDRAGWFRRRSANESCRLLSVLLKPSISTAWGQTP